MILRATEYLDKMTHLPTTQIPKEMQISHIISLITSQTNQDTVNDIIITYTSGGTEYKTIKVATLKHATHTKVTRHRIASIILGKYKKQRDYYVDKIKTTN